MKKWLIYYLNILVVGIGIIANLVSCSETHDAKYYYNKQKPYIQGSVEEQKYLDKALELDSLYVDALIEKSVSYNKRGQYAIGMKFLNKGVELDPVEHLGYRGFVKLYMFRDYSGALNDFLRLDGLTPEFRDAPWGEDIYKVIGVSYMGLNDFNKASTYFKRSIAEISKDDGEEWVESRTFLYYGVSLMHEKDWELAIQTFDKYNYYSPENPSGYYYKAKALLLSGIEGSEKDNVRELLFTSLKLSNKGLIETSPYFELPCQIYPSDIEELLQQMMLSKI